ncbi:uncharacterized protein DS421_2g46010 [Arachis hypogaea]|nr:uncharacterized protein DS421_2g46010 [Arachis hypogaea]
MCELVRPWCACGTSLVRQKLPYPRQGQGGKADALECEAGVRWCYQKELWCARKSIGAWDAALPAPRAGQERFGAPGGVVHAVGAARGRCACGWCCQGAKLVRHSNFCPARAKGRARFLPSRLGFEPGRVQTRYFIFLASWHGSGSQGLASSWFFVRTLWHAWVTFFS